MVANNGNHEGLFRGAFMQSGSPIPVGDITNGQICTFSCQYYTWVILIPRNFADYDALVRQTGCSGAADTLDCLRKVDYKVLKAAADLSPGIFSYQVCHLLGTCSRVNTNSRPVPHPCLATSCRRCIPDWQPPATGRRREGRQDPYHQWRLRRRGYPLLSLYLERYH